MPYVMDTIKGDRLAREATRGSPFGPGFSEAQVKGAERMIITASSFSDPGGDSVVFQLHDASGAVIASRRIAGY